MEDEGAAVLAPAHFDELLLFQPAETLPDRGSVHR